MIPDLRALDLPAFVTLVFDHPAYEGREYEVEGNRVIRKLEDRPQEWYWQVDWDAIPSEPLHTLGLITELFERAGELRGRFTPRQLDQGFKLLLGPAGADPFTRPLWDAALPWPPRERFLRAVIPLYAALFDVVTEIEYVPFMLWDLLLGFRYHDPGLAEPPSADDARIRTLVVDLIREQLLALGGPWSVPSGLHGAYHVNAPEALAAVREWLTSSGSDDEYYRGYAERVLRGAAM